MDDALYPSLFSGVDAMKSATLHEYKRSMGNVSRLGLLLQLVGDDGKISWGEIAPLDSFSGESLEDATKEVLNEIPYLYKQEWNPTHLSPSVHFGIESALLDHLMPIETPTPKVNALLSGSTDAIWEKGQNLDGYEAVKIKVGHLDLSEGLALLKDLLPHFPPEIKIRIDANQNWTLEDALIFAHAFPQGTFEYFEEPLSELQDYLSFPFPVALDETVRVLSPEALFLFPHLKALIIKPTLMGGCTRLAPLFKRAHEKGIAFILGSSYESELGISLLAKLGARLGLPHVPMGLDTYDLFEEPLFEETIQRDQGKLIFPKNWNLKTCVTTSA